MLGAVEDLRRDHLIADYLEDTAQLAVQKAVHIQCADGPGDPTAETLWLDSIAASTGFPQAMVAFVDLYGESAPSDLERQAAYPAVRGIRDLLPGREQNWADKTFRRNLARLPAHRLHYELRCRVADVDAATELVRAVPSVQFVLSHAGLPMERGSSAFATWCSGIQRLSSHPNVWCKLSGFGMVAYANATRLNAQDIRPYFRACVDAFGIDRLMFGSNWPVDRLACRYSELVSQYELGLADLSAQERDRIFRSNAEHFYRL